MSFTRDNAGDNRDSFPDYYLPKVPKDTQQISFIGNLENQDHGATIFFIIEKSEETTFNFLQNSIIIIWIMETQKIVNLLNSTNNESSKFATKKWCIINSE